MEKKMETPIVYYGIYLDYICTTEKETETLIAY